MNGIQKSYHSEGVDFSRGDRIRPQLLARGTRRKVINFIRFVLTNDLLDRFSMKARILNNLDPLLDMENIVRSLTRNSSYNTIPLAEKKLCQVASILTVDAGD